MKKTIFCLGILISSITYGQVNTLKESIYFSLGKTSLSKAHKSKLDSVLRLIKSSNSYNGEIKGYTCNIGSTSINKMISNLRALNVYNYLIDKGAKRANLTYIGLGEQNPQGDNSTESGRRQNRRADIELILELMDAPNNTRVVSEYTGFLNNEANKNTNANSASNIKIDNVEPSEFKPSVALGPNFSSGQFAAATATRIEASNGIVIDINKNTLITNSKVPVEMDFKDFSMNSEIIKKGLQTKSGKDELSLFAAFNTNLTQEYQDLGISPKDPLKVLIPGDYDPRIKLYSNHKNWTLDTINKLSYDEYKHAYVVDVINNNQMIGLLRPIAEEPTDTLIYLKIKIKGLDPKLIRPYVIYDDCTISQGYHYKGKFFIFPISKISNQYRLRAAYTDYSTKSPEAYSLNFDITGLTPVGKVPKREKGSIITMRYPDKVFMKKEKLPVSSLCETPREAAIQK